MFLVTWSSDLRVKHCCSVRISRDEGSIDHVSILCVVDNNDPWVFIKKHSKLQGVILPEEEPHLCWSNLCKLTWPIKTELLRSHVCVGCDEVIHCEQSFILITLPILPVSPSADSSVRSSECSQVWCFAALQVGDSVQWKETLCFAATRWISDASPEAEEDSASSWFPR